MEIIAQMLKVISDSMNSVGQGLKGIDAMGVPRRRASKPLNTEWAPPVAARVGFRCADGNRDARRRSARQLENSDRDRVARKR